MNDRLEELILRGIDGLDGSPGDSLCYWAKCEIMRLRSALDRLARPFFREEGATVYDENTRLRAELVVLREAQHQSWCDQHERLIAVCDRAEKAERELATLRGTPDTGDDSLCNVRRIRSELATARDALRNCALAASGGNIDQVAWIVSSALVHTAVDGVKT